MFTLTTTSKTMRGSIAIFSMPMMHTPLSLMYVMRLLCVIMEKLWRIGELTR